MCGQKRKIHWLLIMYVDVTLFSNCNAVEQERVCHVATKLIEKSKILVSWKGFFAYYIKALEVIFLYCKCLFQCMWRPSRQWLDCRSVGQSLLFLALHRISCGPLQYALHYRPIGLLGAPKCVASPMVRSRLHLRLNLYTWYGTSRENG